MGAWLISATLLSFGCLHGQENSGTSTSESPGIRKLLDRAPVPDFPELPEWNDFVAELGLTVTPELQIDIATDINDAYSEDAPLERLLRKFRVLSLARSPLRARIDILRQIAKRDGSAPYWKEDLKGYEEVRIRQIGDEAREAINGQDYDTVRKLADELHNKSRLVKPDRRVAERIDQTMAKLKRLDALKKLIAVTKQVQHVLRTRKM